MKFKHRLSRQEREHVLNSLIWRKEDQLAHLRILNYEALNLMREEVESMKIALVTNWENQLNQRDPLMEMYLAENLKQAKALQTEIDETESEIKKYAFNQTVIQSLKETERKDIEFYIDAEAWENLYWNEVDDFNADTKIVYIYADYYQYRIHKEVEREIIPLSGEISPFANFNYRPEILTLNFKRMGFNPDVTLVFDYLSETNTLYLRRKL